MARSLLVTSGIVLALAFLMSIVATEAMTDSLRRWVLTGPADQTLQRQQLAAQMQAKGVASTPQEIADARIQSRWLVALALLVAFIGILNAMLMSVTERFREIGTMKCLGALDGFIVKLFLLESLFQGVVGTVLGVILGLGLSLVSTATSYGKDAWRDVPVGQLFVRVMICLVIGILLTVAGAVYPAWQAARMQPIEAMRVET
jgi:cell division protein FtsX